MDDEIAIDDLAKLNTDNPSATEVAGRCMHDGYMLALADVLALLKEYPLDESSRVAGRWYLTCDFHELKAKVEALRFDD